MTIPKTRVGQGTLLWAGTTVRLHAALESWPLPEVAPGGVASPFVELTPGREQGVSATYVGGYFGGSHASILSCLSDDARCAPIVPIGSPSGTALVLEHGFKNGCRSCGSFPRGWGFSLGSNEPWHSLHHHRRHHQLGTASNMFPDSRHRNAAVQSWSQG